MLVDPALVLFWQAELVSFLQPVLYLFSSVVDVIFI